MPPGFHLARFTLPDPETFRGCAQVPQRMTISEARRQFAALMSAARSRQLTPKEKSDLSYARQQLRADRKGARRNPSRAHTVPGLSAWHTYAGGTSVREGVYSYVWKVPGHPTAQVSIDPLPFPHRRGYSVNTFAIPPHTGHQRHGTVSSPAQGVTLARKIWDAAQGSNPRRSRRNPDVCPTCGKPADRPYRRKDARGHVVAGCVDAFHGKPDAWAKSREAGAIRARSARFRKPGPVHNPGGLVRMGKLVEIRYYRDHGRAKGFYKHPFKVRPTIYYRPSDNSILIKGGK